MGIRFVKTLLSVISFSSSVLCACARYMHRCAGIPVCALAYGSKISMLNAYHMCGCSSRRLTWVLETALRSSGRPGNTLSHCDWACSCGNANTCLLALVGLNSDQILYFLAEHLFKCPIYQFVLKSIFSDV